MSASHEKIRIAWKRACEILDECSHVAMDSLIGLQHFRLTIILKHGVKSASQEMAVSSAGPQMQRDMKLSTSVSS